MVQDTENRDGARHRESRDGTKHIGNRNGARTQGARHIGNRDGTRHIGNRDGAEYIKVYKLLWTHKRIAASHLLKWLLGLEIARTHREPRYIQNTTGANTLGSVRLSTRLTHPIDQSKHSHKGFSKSHAFNEYK